METLRLLVTDDEPVVRRSVEAALRGFSVHVPEANTEVNLAIEHTATGESALERIQADAPDILVLDQHLPGIDGLEVLSRITELKADTVTIMITGYASIQTAVNATKSGAYDFLPKPFAPKDLKSAVQKAVIRVLLARQARRLEEEKRQVRFQFIRVLGHELKAPLNAIDGYLQLLAGRAAGDEVAAYDEAITRSLARVEHMRKLIADLLDITRIESGLKHRELTEVDVTVAARAAIDAIRTEADRRGIRVELHASSPAMLVADRGELDMLLSNLLSNAVKYNRDRGRVDVYIARNSSELIIRVSDTGIGISSEDAARLFSEFVRIKTKETREIPGSGLGLSIVRKLARLYGGDADVSSTPGAGSTFSVVLTDASPSAQPTVVAAAPVGVEN